MKQFKKYLAIATAIIGGIIAFLLGQKKSDRDMAKMKKVAKQMDEEVKRYKAKAKASEEKTKESEAKANESIEDHRAKFGDTIDDTMEYIKTGKRRN